MAPASKIVGRGPTPRFHRTVSPLFKAKPTGGSNGDALPPPDLTLQLPRHHQRRLGIGIDIELGGARLAIFFGEREIMMRCEITMISQGAISPQCVKS